MAPPRDSDFLSKGAEIRDVGSIHWEEKTGLGVVKKKKKKNSSHMKPLVREIFVLHGELI